MTTAQTTTHTILRAEGFSCPSCVAKIGKSVGRLPGVKKVKVHFALGRIEVAHDASRTDVDALVQAVAMRGYAARPVRPIG